MSRRKKAAVRETRQAPRPEPTPEVEVAPVATAPTSGPPGEVLEDGGYCNRQIVMKSGGDGWRCSCGASGPAGRTRDGMPYFSDEVLLHRPGERKGPLPVLRHEHIRREV